MEIRKVRVQISSSITSSQVFVPIVIHFVNNPQEQINNQTPYYNQWAYNERTTKKIELRRLTIFYDYVVYLHESEFDAIKS